MEANLVSKTKYKLNKYFYDGFLFVCNFEISTPCINTYLYFNLYLQYSGRVVCFPDQFLFFLIAKWQIILLIFATLAYQGKRYTSINY